MSNTFEDRAVRYVSDLIRDFKLEDYQAAGFPGNFGVETGGFTKTQEEGMASGRGGLGDAQWTGPRRRVFEEWIERKDAKNWTSWDYDANYSMLFRELEGDEGAALVAVRTARTVDEATEIIMRRYERPGVEHLERRKEYGRQALAAFRARGIDIAALKAQGRPGQAAGNTGIVLPPGAGGPIALEPANPLAGMISAMQAHKGEARKITMGVIGAHNLFYPDDPIVVQQKPAAPVPARTGRPSVQLGFAGVIGSLIGMATGHIGTPLGMGEVPTVAGNVAPLVSALVGGVGLLGGGWGGLLKGGLSIVGSLASMAQKR